MKAAPHLVRIIGTQIFETSFFIFQTIGRLIYELALEFPCTKATDETIPEREVAVRGENPPGLSLDSSALLLGSGSFVLRPLRVPPLRRSAFHALGAPFIL